MRGKVKGSGLTKNPYRYSERIIATQPANLIGYWPTPLVGALGNGITIPDLSGQGNDAVTINLPFASDGIGDGRNSYRLDASVGAVNCYSAGLASDFNGPAGTFLGWFKPNTEATWGDQLRRLWYFAADNQNRMYAQHTAGGAANIVYEANDVATFATFSPSGTDWRPWAITWDINAGATGEVIGYEYGSRVGAIATGLGVWSGSLDSNECVFGASNDTPAWGFHGWCQHPAMWNVALTPAELLNLATV